MEQKITSQIARTNSTDTRARIVKIWPYLVLFQTLNQRQLHPLLRLYQVRILNLCNLDFATVEENVWMRQIVSTIARNGRTQMRNVQPTSIIIMPRNAVIASCDQKTTPTATSIGSRQMESSSWPLEQSANFSEFRKTRIQTPGDTAHIFSNKLINSCKT